MSGRGDIGKGHLQCHVSVGGMIGTDIIFPGTPEKSPKAFSSGEMREHMRALVDLLIDSDTPDCSKLGRKPEFLGFSVLSPFYFTKVEPSLSTFSINSYLFCRHFKINFAAVSILQNEDLSF